MKDKSNLLAILLVIITVVVLILTSVFGKKEDVVKKDIRIVTNYSNFYTVNSCLYRTITYINSGDTESLLLVLTDQYKKDNNIDESNVLSIFANIENNSSFNPQKMYYENLNKNITKYYVYGYIEEDILTEDVEISNPNKKTAYFIVYLDTAKEIFSVEPYSGDIFLEGDADE